jgi:hypothetical protein
VALWVAAMLYGVLQSLPLGGLGWVGCGTRGVGWVTVSVGLLVHEGQWDQVCMAQYHLWGVRLPEESAEI